MKLYLCGHSDRYALEQLQLCLFPLEPVETEEKPKSGSRVPRLPDGTDHAVSRLSRGARFLTATARITRGGVTTHAVQRLALANETYALRRRILQRAYYLAALPHLPAPPPWGALSGVRPTKLTTRHLLEGGTPASADRLLRDTFFVSPARRKLCVRASEFTVEAASLLAPTDVSVYIGIPFCPTRCAYCSFVSQTAGSAGTLLAPYLDCLLREIETVGEHLRAAGRSVRTLYIGGGTPTVLSADQLRVLMEAVNRHFDRSRLIEYTVEGGRPDTLDPEKLRLIRDLGADLFQNRAGLPDQAAVETMVRTADELLAARGYEPYYLYRQKYMSGSLENVGWCRDGDRCLYNIYMMEELHSILALGGGAVSKRMLSPTKLERQCNPKYPKEYVARIEDVLAAKRDLIAALAAPEADPNRKEPTEYEN